MNMNFCVEPMIHDQIYVLHVRVALLDQIISPFYN